MLSVIQDLSESDTRIKINLNDKINDVSSDPLNIIDRTKNVENYSQKLTNANKIESKSVFDNFGELMMESISRVLAQFYGINLHVDQAIQPFQKNDFSVRDLPGIYKIWLKFQIS